MAGVVTLQICQLCSWICERLEAHVRGHARQVLVRHLEVALDAAAAVLGALAVVPVREEERQARLPATASPEEMNWSMMICAELAGRQLRLPHHQRVGVLERCPSSEASTPNSESEELLTVKKFLGLFVAAYTWRRGTPLARVLVVNQRVAVRKRAPLDAWPDNRTWLPSSSSVPNASASAMAQSRPSPVSIIFLRAS